MAANIVDPSLQRLNMMNMFMRSAALAMLLAATVGQAESGATGDRPSFFASESMMATAVVEAIDHETRVVTLRGPQGNALTFTAGEEIRNLAQVEVGDLVDAEYVETISIEVSADDGSGPGRGDLAAVARAEQGEKPGMAAMDAQVIAATVIAIDVEAGTFQLQGLEGNVREFHAANPANLTRASVGDLVVMTTTSSVAVSVRAHMEQ